MNRCLFVLFCISILISCASTKQVITEQPLKYSYLPEKLDIDLLMPPNEQKDVLDTTLPDFKTVPIDTGRLITIYKDTFNIPSGNLFSERKTTQFIYFRNNNLYLDRKLVLQKKLYDEYYDKSLKAEEVYQNEIIKLNKKAERSWLEKNIVYFGFIAGIATAVLTEFAVIHTQQ